MHYVHTYTTSELTKPRLPGPRTNPAAGAANHDNLSAKIATHYGATHALNFEVARQLMYPLTYVVRPHDLVALSIPSWEKGKQFPQDATHASRFECSSLAATLRYSDRRLRDCANVGLRFAFAMAMSQKCLDRDAA